MKQFSLVLLLALYGCTKQPLPQPEAPSTQATPVATATSTPVPSSSHLVELGSDLGSDVSKIFAQKALDFINRAYASGCLKKEFLSHSFISLNNVAGKRVETREEAYNRYVAGAPYRLDLRWYTKRSSKTVGYTYVYKDGKDSGPTETRIYSNTKYMASAADYASHLGHELSHQARAGGFVHYTIFKGSVPYELNTILETCFESQ